ncbi:MAG: PaaI family thioesterase [Syntrophobacterales bacterium]|jgi:acyl-CoA thioesterase|nr:PaaI family thioesterase [Syntrophobacterales bacterium]
MDDKTKSAFMKKVNEEPFAKFLGIKLVDVDNGYALCEMHYREEMDNIHHTAHGGAVFSLIDEAFEISSNSHGTMAVALNMNITYIKPAVRNSLLRAESTEMSRGRKTATYQITVKDDEGLIAICQALVYRKNDKLTFIG